MHGPIPASPLMQRWFSGLLVYYCFLQYLMPSDGELARSSVLYVLTLAPVATFAIAGTMKALAIRGLRMPGALTLAFTVLVIGVAFLRGDYATVTACGLTGLTLFPIFSLGLSASPSLLNRLFLASLILGIAMTTFGLIPYGAWPGTGPPTEPVFRVGFTPFIATAGFFAAIIVVLNLFRKDVPLRLPCLALGAYFLIFSMVRSALIATVLAVIFLAMTRLGFMTRPSLRMTFLPLAILGLILVLQADQILLLLSGWGGDTLNTFLFRSDQGIGSSEEAKKSIFRIWLWTEHLRLAGHNPLFGIGTFNLKSVTILDELLEGASSGTEAWLTGMLARVGAPVALLIADIWILIRRALDAPADLVPMGAGLILLTAMLVYGSFLTPYDFLFLVLAGLVVRGATHHPR